MSAVLPTKAAEAPTYDALVLKGLAGPNILLNGEAGTGKTYALGTLVDWCQANGKEAVYLDIEGSLETLLGYWTDTKKAIPPCLSWCQIKTAPVTLTQMIKGAKDTGDLSYEMLTKLVDSSRGSNNAFLAILNAMANFKDDRTGRILGDVTKFGVDKVFMLDSFTELSNAAAKMVIGAKPTMAPPEYGVTQNHLMNFLRLVCHGMVCTFVMTSHPVRDKDEISGAVKTTIKTIGTAIQPEIPPLFSEVLFSVREADKFYWDTAAYGVVSKTRSLGYKSKIVPDFAQIMAVWKARGGK